MLARALLARPRTRAARARAAARALPAPARSTSSRTPTRSRSSSRRCSAPAIPMRRHAALAGDRRSIPGGCSSSATRSSRSTGSAAPTSRRSSPRPMRFADPAPLHLTCNFRTAPGVLDWINAVFAELITPHPGSQPEYRALDAARADPAATGSVTLLGVEAHDDGPDADELRAREAERRCRVRSAACSPIERRSSIATPSHGARLGSATSASCSRPARRSAFSSARSTTRVCRTAPSRARWCTRTREVRDLHRDAARDRRSQRRARARERVAVVAVRLRRRRPVHLPCRAPAVTGTFGARVPRRFPPTIRSREALALSCAISHEDRLWATPSELLERIVRERRVLEVGALGSRFRDVARRVRFVVDQARAFADARGRNAARLPRVGRRCRARMVRGSSKRCCPRPTTTRFAS